MRGRAWWVRWALRLCCKELAKGFDMGLLEQGGVRDEVCALGAGEVSVEGAVVLGVEVVDD